MTEENKIKRLVKLGIGVENMCPPGSGMVGWLSAVSRLGKFNFAEVHSLITTLESQLQEYLDLYLEEMFGVEDGDWDLLEAEVRYDGPKLLLTWQGEELLVMNQERFEKIKQDFGFVDVITEEGFKWIPWKD